MYLKHKSNSSSNSFTNIYTDASMHMQHLTIVSGWGGASFSYFINS